jgi:hypothetical protein
MSSVTTGAQTSTVHVYAYAIDSVGNRSALYDSGELTPDTTGPALSSYSNVTGSQTPDSLTFNITSDSDGTLYYKIDKTKDISSTKPDTDWTTTKPLASGTHSYQINDSTTGDVYAHFYGEDSNNYYGSVVTVGPIDRTTPTLSSPYASQMPGLPKLILKQPFLAMQQAHIIIAAQVTVDTENIVYGDLESVNSSWMKDSALKSTGKLINHQNFRLATRRYCKCWHVSCLCHGNG